MTDVKQLITEHLDIWLTAEAEKKSGRGRSSGSSDMIYGVQKLRELILELAFLGKLVPNSTKVSDIKEKILEEQKKLIQEKILKKPTAVNILDNSEFMYPLPQTWALINLVDAGYNLGQKTPESEFSYVDVSAINSLYGRVENPTILNADEAPSRARKIIKEGTVIYSTVRPYLNNIAVIDTPFEYEPIASTAFAVIHPYKIIDSYYLFYYLRSPLFVEYVESQQIGIAYPAINDKQFFSGLLPLPPLEEQQRIVAKVDELMQLCDQLEQQQNLSSDAHATLVDTLLKALTESSDAEEFQANWQRIVENFDLLFTTDYSIEQLKQSILQLAVIGKLVKQNPSDEPASELLKQIAEEKVKLIKEGKIKKSKPLPEISEDEKPFELPIGWEWTRLLEISDLKGGFAYKSELFTESGNNQVIRMGSVRPNLLRLDEKAVFINNSLASDTHDSELFENDIVITMTGTRGKKDYLYTALVKNEYISSKKLFLNQRLTCIRANEIVVNPHFLNLLLKVDNILQPLFDSATGTANQANVGMLALGNTIIPLSPLNEQKRIVEKVNQLFSMIEQLQALQSKLQKTKLQLADSLVANAVEGV